MPHKEGFPTVCRTKKDSQLYTTKNTKKNEMISCEQWTVKWIWCTMWVIFYLNFSREKVTAGSRRACWLVNYLPHTAGIIESKPIRCFPNFKGFPPTRLTSDTWSHFWIEVIVIEGEREVGLVVRESRNWDPYIIYTAKFIVCRVEINLCYRAANHLSNLSSEDLFFCRNQRQWRTPLYQISTWFSQFPNYNHCYKLQK